MTHEIRRPGLVGGIAVSITLALAHAVNDLFLAVLGALLPHLRESLDASAMSLAVLVAVLTISASAMQPLLGAVADGMGSRRLLVGGMTVSVVSMSLLGAADSLWTLALLLALGGLGSAAFHPVAMGVVTTAAGRRAAVAAGAFTAGGMLGLAMGPAVVLEYVDRWGLSRMPWLMVPGLLFVVVMWRVLPDWKAHGPGYGRLPWRALARRPVAWMLMTSSLVNLVFLTYLSTTPLWLADTHGVSTGAAVIATVLGAMALAAGAGGLAGGAIGERWGYRRTSVVSLAASTVPFVLMLALPVGGVTVIAAMTGAALLHMSLPLLVVSVQTAVPDAPAAASGVVLGVGAAIAGVLYLGVGAVQGALGFGPVLALVLLLLAPAMAAATKAFPAIAPAGLERAVDEDLAADQGQPDRAAA